LLDYAGWLETSGETAAAEQARRYGENSGLGTELELAGPVGERNLYALHPRGRILIRPVSAAGLRQQVAAVLATGNSVAIDDGAGLAGALAGAPASVMARISPVLPDEPLAGALIEGDADQIRAEARDIATRPGPIVLVQAATPAQCAGVDAYTLDWLVEEVSTSINTTAAGGNASLMTLA